MEAILTECAVGVSGGEELFAGKQSGEQERNPQRGRSDAQQGVVIRTACEREEDDSEGVEEKRLQDGLRVAQAGVQFAADEGGKHEAGGDNGARKDIPSARCVSYAFCRRFVIAPFRGIMSPRLCRSIHKHQGVNG